jgi:hypothetical protein
MPMRAHARVRAHPECTHTPARTRAHAAGDGNMHVGLKFDRIKYWLTAGAQPTPKVRLPANPLTHASFLAGARTPACLLARGVCTRCVGCLRVCVGGVCCACADGL